MTDYLARREDVALPDPVHEVQCPNCDTTIRARMADAPDTLAAYQRKVRRAAISLANENDYCIEGLNDWLVRVDLTPFRDTGSEFYGTATVTGYYVQDAPALTLEEAGQQVEVRSEDPDVLIDRAFEQAVAAVHEDRVTMVVHVIVRDTTQGPVATRWTIDALELASSRTRRRTVTGRPDPLFDHSAVTTVTFSEPAVTDPDADCWTGC